MARGVSVPSRIRILLKWPSVGEDLPVLNIAFGQNDDAARDFEDSLVIVVGPDSWSPARHAVHVRVEALFDSSFLNQLRRPRLVGYRSLKIRGDIDKFARDLGVVALGAAVGPGYPTPHAGKIRFSLSGARSRGGEVRLAVRGARHSRSRIIQPLGEDGRRDGGQNYRNCVTRSHGHGDSPRFLIIAGIACNCLPETLKRRGAADWLRCRQLKRSYHLS